MRKLKLAFIVLSLLIIPLNQTLADQNSSFGFFKAFCGPDVLSRAFIGLGLAPRKTSGAMAKLNAQAAQKKGMSSLYEVKLAAQECGLKTQALKLNLAGLRVLANQGQLIANTTGNRHFCLVRKVSDNEVAVYVPGINYPDITISSEEFLQSWDRIVLVVSNKPIDLKALKGQFEFVGNEKLKEVIGGQGCGNISGHGSGYTGAGGPGRESQGNGPAKNNTDSSDGRADSTTDEPVVIRNGNLFLDYADIQAPTRSLPLSLKRYYNSEVVSEVPGWLAEPGAGSWCIENREYSGQGDRTTSDLIVNNFTMDLDMQTIQPGPHYAWETAWVNFRYTEKTSDPRKAQDCYYFLIHTNGVLELSKWKSGVQYFLLNKPSPYLAANKNHIKIIANAGNIKIYVNGSLQISYSDPNPVLSGRVALQAYFSHAHFSNIKISQGGHNYTYDFSQDDNDFIFGYGWTHSYSLRIKEYKTHVTVFRENNSRETYVPKGDGTYFSVPVNYYSHLTKDASGFSLKSKNGTHYRFNLSGRLVYIEDRKLNRTTLSYSTVNNKAVLTSITEPAGRKITLQYGANAMVSKALDPQKNYLQYFYDAKNRLVRVIDRNGNATNYSYDPVTSNLIQLTDPRKNVYKYTYLYNDRVNTQTDPLGNITAFDYLWSTVHVINKRGEVYKYNFDSLLSLQSIADPNNITERTINDANGNIIDYYDKRNYHTHFTYDANANRTGVYDANGKWTKWSYDAGLNLPLSFSDANGNTCNFVYDKKGNLTQFVNAQGEVTKNTYNSYGQLISSIDARGNISKFAYNAYGNLAKKTDAAGNVTAYGYDILGRVVKTINPAGYTTLFTYDKNGNLTSITDASGNVTRYAYDYGGRVVSVTDPLGSISKYAYDCFGNLLSITDALGRATRYAYDTANQMHLGKASLLSVTDAKGNKTTYNYDALGRLIKMTDAQSRVYQYTYDKQGNLASRTDANNITTSYQYDSLNRLRYIQYPNSSTVTYVLDNVGNTVKIQDSSGVTAFNYDRVNRLKSQVYPDGFRLDYSYDLNGNRSVLGIAGFGRITYGYDSLNNITAISLPNGKKARFSYDSLSRRARLDYPNGALTAYTYDNSSRLIQLLNKNSANKAVSSFSYTYDNASRKTAVSLINGSLNYAYDKLNELTREAGSLNAKSVSSTFAYDPAGNRYSLNKNGQAVNYIYNTLNQLTKDSTGITFSYDKNGNLTQRKSSAATENFTYDYENRMKSYTAPGQNSAFAYDSSGKRISKTVNGVTTKYYYDGNELVRESAGVNNVYYVHGPRVGEIISDSKGYCYHYDSLGSVVNLTNATGASVQAYGYDAFGNIVTQSGSSTNDNKFLTKKMDVSGLIYFGARYYDPRIGRFISRDPLGFVDGPNPYLYCLNDPINLVDPWGLCGEKKNTSDQYRSPWWERWFWEPSGERRKVWTWETQYTLPPESVIAAGWVGDVQVYWRNQSHYEQWGRWKWYFSEYPRAWGYQSGDKYSDPTEGVAIPSGPTHEVIIIAPKPNENPEP
ncbi:MAG: RHS repeat-associated core domain-containing protein [Candidatus Omnitrophota bacterium]